MSDEDDLPVLTQILVTANGRAPSSVARRAAPVEAVSDGHEEPVLQRLLVIGNDPDEPADVDPADAAVVDPVADPRRPTLRDVFSATVPNGDDHASPGTGSGAFADPEHPWVMDEPHIDRYAIGRSSVEPGSDDDAHGADAFSTAPPVEAGSFTSRPLLPLAESDVGFASAVRDEVLVRLASRIDTELDARIAQAIRTELDAAIAHLQTRLRAELSAALRDVVGRAVDEAITRRGLTGASGEPGPR